MFDPGDTECIGELYSANDGFVVSDNSPYWHAEWEIRAADVNASEQNLDLQPDPNSVGRSMPLTLLLFCSECCLLSVAEFRIDCSVACVGEGASIMVVVAVERFRVWP